MAFEVDIQEEIDFFVRKVPLYAEKPPIERLSADAPDCGQHLGFIAWLERSDLQAASIAGLLNDGEPGRIRLTHLSAISPL